MAFGEPRVARNRVLPRAALRLDVASSLVELAQVELRHVAAWMRRDFVAVFDDRASGVTALFGRQRQVEVGEPQARTLGERRFNLQVGARYVAALEFQCPD